MLFRLDSSLTVKSNTSSFIGTSFFLPSSERLYSAFRRLEKEGFISSYWGDEEAGARRRYYTITDKGRTAYEENRAEWDELKLLIDEMIAPQGEEEKNTKKKRGILG